VKTGAGGSASTSNYYSVNKFWYSGSARARTVFDGRYRANILFVLQNGMPVQYSGTVSDPDCDRIARQHSYAVNGGTRQGSGASDSEFSRDGLIFNHDTELNQLCKIN